MRITGGEWCGRRLRVPKGDVRPTTDRVRESLFAILREIVPGRRFLDLFAGTGAVGLDALSRGATDVTWVEGDRRVIPILMENVAMLGVARHSVICADVLRFLRHRGHGKTYDIIYADPPYAFWADTRAAGQLLAPGQLPAMLSADGWIVLEQGTSREVQEPAMDGMRLVDRRRYGNSQLWFFRQGES